MTGVGSTSTYRWSRAYGLRLFAVTLVALAIGWVLAALLNFPSWALVVLAVVAALAAAILLRLVALPPLLLEISGEGYRLRSTRGGGVRSAGWQDVDSIWSEETASGSVMVIRLADARSSLVPLSMLGADGPAAERDMHERLNIAFGYRRLDG